MSRDGERAEQARVVTRELGELRGSPAVHTCDMGVTVPSSPAVWENVGWIKYIKVAPRAFILKYLYSSGDSNISCTVWGGVEEKCVCPSFHLGLP